MKLDRETKVKIVGWSIILFVFMATLELSSYAVYKIILLPKANFLVYYPPDKLEENRYTDYLETRSNLLGWPESSEQNSSRFTPSFPSSRDNCISIYGDSFVYAFDVKDADAWGNLLSEKFGCRVGNFGVNGYGTDQAYLRFLDNTQDQAPITILGIYPENVLRNVNQYRYFLAGGDLYSFKPRFILVDETLSLLPLPTIKYEELDLFYQNPEQYLENESFLPNSTYGATKVSFPYSSALLRIIFKERTLNWFLNKPSWEGFWQPEHPTQSFEITSAIVSEFYGECDQRDKKCLIIIFPTATSFDWFQQSNRLITQSLIMTLEEDGREVLDLTEGISTKLEDDTFCDILTKPSICQGHFNVEGNRIVAEVIQEYLVAIGYMVMESK